MSSRVPKFDFEDPPPAKPAKVAKHYSRGPQASPPSRPVSCAAACHWYASNPCNHDPDFGAWCHRQMEHLVVGSPTCEEFRRGDG